MMKTVSYLPPSLLEKVIQVSYVVASSRSPEGVGSESAGVLVLFRVILANS